VEGWRRLQIEKLHNLYDSPFIIMIIKSRRMRQAGHVARMGQMKNAYNSSVGKPEIKRPLGRFRRRWKVDIRMDIREICANVWMGLSCSG
jgi:hypothetical protein